MKYWSEKLNRLFDTEKACQDAEFKAKEEENRERAQKEREARLKKEKEEKLAAERKTRAAEVEEARKTMVAAQHKYKEVLESFIEQFGSYHYTSQSFNDIPILFSSLFDFFK